MVNDSHDSVKFSLISRPKNIPTLVSDQSDSIAYIYPNYELHGRNNILKTPKQSKKARHAMRGELHRRTQQGIFKAWHHFDGLLGQDVAKYSANTHAKSKATIANFHADESIRLGNIDNQKVKVKVIKKPRHKKR